MGYTGTRAAPRKSRGRIHRFEITLSVKIPCAKEKEQENARMIHIGGKNEIIIQVHKPREGSEITRGDRADTIR